MLDEIITGLQALETVPSLFAVKVSLDRAAALSRLGRHDDAIALYDRGIEWFAANQVSLSRASVAAHSNRAMAQARTGDRSAVEAIDDIIERCAVSRAAAPLLTLDLLEQRFQILAHLGLVDQVTHALGQVVARTNYFFGPDHPRARTVQQVLDAANINAALVIESVTGPLLGGTLADYMRLEEYLWTGREDYALLTGTAGRRLRARRELSERLLSRHQILVLPVTLLESIWMYPRLLARAEARLAEESAAR